MYKQLFEYFSLQFQKSNFVSKMSSRASSSNEVADEFVIPESPVEPTSSPMPDVEQLDQEEMRKLLNEENPTLAVNVSEVRTMGEHQSYYYRVHQPASLQSTCLAIFVEHMHEYDFNYQFTGGKNYSEYPPEEKTPFENFICTRFNDIKVTCKAREYFYDIHCHCFYDVDFDNYEMGECVCEPRLESFVDVHDFTLSNPRFVELCERGDIELHFTAYQPVQLSNFLNITKPYFPQNYSKKCFKDYDMTENEWNLFLKKFYNLSM